MLAFTTSFLLTLSVKRPNWILSVTLLNSILVQPSDAYLLHFSPSYKLAIFFFLVHFNPLFILFYGSSYYHDLIDAVDVTWCRGFAFALMKTLLFKTRAITWFVCLRYLCPVRVQYLCQYSASWLCTSNWLTSARSKYLQVPLYELLYIAFDNEMSGSIAA